MYTREDVLCARKRVRMAVLGMAAVLLLLLAGYVLALAQGWYGLTAILAVAMLAFVFFTGDLLLMPRMRYARFLKEMGRGLRRSVDCILLEAGDETQLQDGVYVRFLQVKMPDGDSRIFYMNADKMPFLPEMGRAVRLVSYGRHVVELLEN